MTPSVSSTFKQVACLACDHMMPATLDVVACTSCGSPWVDARYDYEAVSKLWPDGLGNNADGLWRYKHLLPVNDVHRVTMVEGATPLFQATRLGDYLNHKHIYIKDERRGPTSSFKDRQASLAVSALVASGVKDAVIASTGNAATAYAAYCARAGIKLWVFLTSQVPGEKMREISLYGADVIKVTGTYDQTKVVAASFAKRHGIHYERGAKAIASKESMKTMAFEIAEQLNWHTPDWFIQAVSGGLGPIGVWKGFTELKQIGMVDSLPRLGIIQVDGCAPMVRAFEQDQEEAEPIEPRTAITVLSTGAPGFGYTYLYRATKQMGGTMVSVSDDEAFTWMRRLARLEGISVEPATAVAFAGFAKMVAQGLVAPEHKVVINASGHTMPVEKFILSDQQVVDIAVKSELADQWGVLPEEGLGAALEFLDERITSIVVIDDSPQDSRLIKRLLQRHKSYRIFEANDPDTGLDLVRYRQPDLVIVDLMMPNVNGFDLIDTLKADELTAEIPVIVVSGKTLSQTEQNDLERKTVSLWVKGNYNTHDLVNHIVTTLGDEPRLLPSSDNNKHPEGTTIPTKAPAASEFEQSQFKLLLVEDNPLDGRLLKRTLKDQRQCEVYEAHTGEQAIEFLEQMAPDLIILDLMLPDMTGIELLEHLREHSIAQETPVILLTAKDLTRKERKILETRVDKTLTKGAIERTMLQKEIMSMFDKAN